MEMVPISEAKARLTELARVADDEPVMLLRHSRPAAVLLSARRYDGLLDRLEDAEDLVTVLRARAEETIPWADLKQQMAEDDAEQDAASGQVGRVTT